MPGICGVVELWSEGRSGPEAEASTLLERMTTVLTEANRSSGEPRYRVLAETRVGSVCVAAVGVSSYCHMPMMRGVPVAEPAPVGASRETPAGPSEILSFWYGEIYDGRAAREGAASREFTADPWPSPGDVAGLAGALARQSGMFVGLEVDPRSGEFALFTDVMAALPLFTRRVGRHLAFAPEAKALVALDPSSVRGDVASLAFFLATGYVPPGRSHVEGIAPVPGATLLTGQSARSGRRADSRELEARRYWQLRYAPGGDRIGAGEMADLVREVVASQLGANERVGVLLSGGYDSRGLLGASVEAGARVGTVTWGFDAELAGSDAAVARELAVAFGVPHRFVPLEAAPLRENASRWVYMMDAAVDALANYPEGDGVFRRLAADFDVLVRGDECFGMKWPFGIPNEHVAKACIGVYPFAWHSVFDRLFTPEAYAELERAGRASYDTLDAIPSGAHPVDRKDEYYFAVRFGQYLNPLNQFKMRAIPMRNPLLDRRVLEVVTALPRARRRSKTLFKTAVCERLAPVDVPFASRTSLVPWPRVVAGTPELSAFFRDCILGASPDLLGWFDRRGLETQLDEWLRPPAAPVDVTRGGRRESRGRLRDWLVERGKHLAYAPHTPELLRRRLMPPRNPRRGFGYAFRLLVIALYVEELASRGIRLRWDPMPAASPPVTDAEDR